jgi:hypothetical protein
MKGFLEANIFVVRMLVARQQAGQAVPGVAKKDSGIERTY